MSSQDGNTNNMEIKIAVVAHPSRMDHVKRVMDAMPEVEFFPFVDYHGIGASRNHHRAIQWSAKQDCRVIIMEDDAVPVEKFLNWAGLLCSLAPNDIISFYLGTSRPKDYQSKVDELLKRSLFKMNIMLDKFIHGVCYTMSQDNYKLAAERYNVNRPADFAIGECFPGKSFVFVKESLVEHLDGESVESHQDKQPRTEPRKARNLAGKLIF